MRIRMNYFTDPGSGNSSSGSRSKEKKPISIFLLLFLLLPLLLFVLVVVLVLLLLLILLLFLLLLFPRRCRRRRLPRRPPPRSCRRPPFPIPTVYVPDPDSYLSIRFVSLHTDPDPTFIIQVRIRITECNKEKKQKTIIVSVAAGQTLESPLLPSCLLVLRDPEQQALVLAVVSEKGREADGSLRKAERKAATFFI